MRRIIFLLLLTVSLAAQETTTTLPEVTHPTTTVAPPVVANIDSRETREQLHEILRRLPPQVGRAIKLDPSLWTNKEYLATYPALSAFIAAHPEVTHSPAYFLENVWIQPEVAPETGSTRVWRDMMEMMSIIAVVLLITTALTWLIRTAIEHRRWTRVSKVQADVHNKLLDRFVSNEDLLAYVNTSAGKRFLESAPFALEASPRAIAAPVGRVLWSVQAGLVLIAGGIGLEFVAWSADKEVAQPLGAMGVLAIAVGVGLVVAAAAAYVLSRKLGLVQPEPTLPLGGVEAGGIE